MANVFINDSHLTDIANTIRSINSTNNTYKPREMAEAILSLSVGTISDDDRLLASILSRSITSMSDDTITKIGYSTFEYCQSLTSVSFTKATSIENNAFYSCKQLASINFPLVTSIGSSAFYKCNALTNVVFQGGTSVGNYAFDYCANLTTVDLTNATSIGTGAFYGCSNLTTLILRADDDATRITSLASTSAFSSTPIASGTGYIYVPRRLFNVNDSIGYEINTKWKTYKNQLRAIEDYPDICG